jgi:hypothetical protein
MENKRSLLVRGIIPKGTECPFLNKCKLKDECYHKGKNHLVGFSCSAARHLDLCQ